MRLKNIISKRGNRSPMLIPKDMPRFQIGLHKVLLDQRAKHEKVDIVHKVICGNVTTTTTKTFTNDTHPYKLINIAYRPYGRVFGLDLLVKRQTITRFSLSSLGKVKLNALKCKSNS